MGKPAELAGIRFPQGLSKIPILSQSTVLSPRSTKPSIVPLFQKTNSTSAVMNGDTPNHTSYLKSTDPHLSSSTPATQSARCCLTFQVCGSFSGKDGIPAARWLRNLEQEFRIQDRHTEDIQPVDLLLAIDFLLTGAALKWAEENPIVFTTLTKSHLTVEEVQTIKQMMNERFPAKTVELSTQAFQNRLDNLKQRSEESLIEYYNRVKGMMERVGAKDNNASNTSSFYAVHPSPT